MTYPPNTSTVLACLWYVYSFLSLIAAPLFLLFSTMRHALSGRSLRIRLTRFAFLHCPVWQSCHFEFVKIILHWHKTSWISGCTSESLWMQLNEGKGIISSSSLVVTEMYWASGFLSFVAQLYQTEFLPLSRHRLFYTLWTNLRDRDIVFVNVF